MTSHRKLAIICASCLMCGCIYAVFARTPDTLSRILEERTLTIITAGHSTAFSQFENQLLGFEYEMAKAFADYLGCTLAVKTPKPSRQLEMLNGYEADVMATGRLTADQYKPALGLSQGYMTVRQVIVCHRALKDVKSLEDLNGRTVHVQAGSSHHELLKELNRDHKHINIVAYKDMPARRLIRMVAEKHIEMTLVSSHIANVCRRYYPDIREAFSLRANQHLSWAVRKADKTLLKEINAFMSTFKESGRFHNLYTQYFPGPAEFDYVDLTTYHTRISSRLPRYESLIREEAAKVGFDWTLIAAIIYQESHFDPAAKSHTGVRGIMQVTRETAREMGLSNRLNPEGSIRSGIQYLRKLYERFDDIPNAHDRMTFTLASYNIGYGHVRDAQKIAADKNLAPNMWSSLKQTLPLLRQKKFYKHTKYGYARGHEPVRYVERIIRYHDILKHKLISEQA